ncbi:MAG: ATP-binding domain-containing protein [Candidatus Rokubacteria bacterium]|nr:ATP-binding domain-containing protein [Candidatus Rokubacteria bacterium]
MPDKVLRQGPAPEVRRSSSAKAAFRNALEWIRARLARGVPPDQIMVLGSRWDEMSRLETWLDDAGVPAQVLGRRGQTGAVRLSTVHSSKGLDAECVLLLDAHRLERHDETEARRLLYIAMTRTRSELCVAYHAPSPLLKALRDLAGGRPS